MGPNLFYRSALAFLCLFWSGSLRAESNSALVTWTLHSDSHIQESARLNKQTILRNPQIFGTVKAQEEVPRDAELPVFEKHLDLALRQLVKTESPQLVISLGSHGGVGLVCRNGACGNFELSKVVESIERQVRRHSTTEKPIPVVLLYSGCHSGSIIPSLEEMELRRGFPSSLTVLTSAIASQLSHGNEFENAIQAAITHDARAKEAGLELPGAPIDRVAKLMSTFIVSEFDQPTYWSSQQKERGWKPDDFAKASESAPTGAVLSYETVRSFGKQGQGPGSLSSFASSLSWLYGDLAGIAFALDAKRPEELPDAIVHFLQRRNVDKQDRGVIVAWIDTLPPEKLDRAALDARLAQRGVDLGQFAEEKAAALLRGARSSGTVEVRPGPFPTFEKFIRAVQGAISREKSAPSAIHLALDTAPPDKLNEVVMGILRNPATDEIVAHLVSTWAEFLPADLVSKEQLSEWQRETLAKMSERTREMYRYQKAGFQSEAYSAAKDPMGLLALYRTVPTRMSDGHENYASIALSQAFLNLIVSNRLDSPEHIRAMEEVMAERSGGDHSTMHFWVSSKHKSLNEKVVARALELGYGERLLNEFADRPAEQNRIIEIITNVPWSGPSKRDLLGLLSVRIRAGVTGAADLMKRCLDSFKAVQGHEELLSLYSPLVAPGKNP